MAGAEVPLLACEHFYLLTKPVEGITGTVPTLSDHDSHLYIRDDSGGLLVGCFEPMGKADPAGSAGRELRLWPSARGLGAFRADDGAGVAPPAAARDGRG